jgi:cation diffusion facilitator CzcD-associated flavoprotein CzcO
MSAELRSDPRPRTEAAVDTTCVVVGAGPAGLATSACLREQGVPHVLLERDSQVGSAWARHYRRLHLHTARDHSALPFRPFPRDYPTFPSREQVLTYLHDYAQALHLQPRLGEEVREATSTPVALGPGGAALQGWQVVSSRGSGADAVTCTYRARALVVASGYNGEPNLPDLEGLASFGGPVVHTSRYVDGEPYRGQRALVIGCGNSGAEIAIDLVEHGATTSMVVRGPVHVTLRELFGRPTQDTGILLSHLPTWLADRLALLTGKLFVGDLSKYGIHTPAEGPFTQIRRRGRIPIIDVGMIDLLKKGQLQIVPGVTRLRPGGAVFADGRDLDFDAVILATGYRPSFGRWLAGSEQLVDHLGYPRAHGEEARLPGLFFTGFRNPPTGALREMALEAPRIARAVARMAQHRAAHA